MSKLQVQPLGHAWACLRNRRLPFPPPGDLLYPGIKSVSLASPALAGEFFTNNGT